MGCGQAGKGVSLTALCAALVWADSSVFSTSTSPFISRGQKITMEGAEITVRCVVDTRLSKSGDFAPISSKRHSVG